VRMREQGVARRIIGFDAELGEEMSCLDVHSLSHGGKVCLGIELYGIDTVQVRLTVVGGQLSIEQTTRQREAIIGAWQDRIAAKAAGRLCCAARYARSFDAPPVLPEKAVTGAGSESHRQITASLRAGRE